MANVLANRKSAVSLPEAAEFYANLKQIGSFTETADPSLYIPLPEDWHLAVADVRGSTDAIRLGRYKEVNMAGACIIAALNNLYGEEQMLPYLFGGDGALIALPGKKIDSAKAVLAHCRVAVREAFGLEMSAGIVSMREVRERGHEVAAARLRLSDTIDQTVFWGSGITWVEDHVKANDLLATVVPQVADLSGLECRWSQVPSNRDEIVAYIIQANGANDIENVSIYNECFDRIGEIYGSERDFHPVDLEGLNLTFKPELLRVEWRLRTHGMSWWGKFRYAASMLFLQIAGRYLMANNKRTDETDWSEYKPDFIRHVDYRKFGDALRFVATGTIDQRMQLYAYLETQFRAKRLIYGLHPSFAAILTCYVKSYQRNHVHFVDGSDGGYAKASQELKNRRKML